MRATDNDKRGTAREGVKERERERGRTTCIVAIWCQVAFENALISILFIYDMPETRQVVKLDNSSLGISNGQMKNIFHFIIKNLIADLQLADYKAKLHSNKWDLRRERIKELENAKRL